MLAYIIRRLVYGVVTLLALSIIVFFLIIAATVYASRFVEHTMTHAFERRGLRDKGSIAVQVHGGGGWPKGAKVRWKNIRIKPL